MCKVLKGIKVAQSRNYNGVVPWKQRYPFPSVLNFDLIVFC